MTSEHQSKGLVSGLLIGIVTAVLGGILLAVLQPNLQHPDLRFVRPDIFATTDGWWEMDIEVHNDSSKSATGCVAHLEGTYNDTHWSAPSTDFWVPGQGDAINLYSFKGLPRFEIQEVDDPNADAYMYIKCADNYTTSRWSGFNFNASNWRDPYHTITRKFP